MDRKFFEEVICFTKEFSAEEKIIYNEDTDIEKDVGITGDDASEYITAFGKKFDVDLSGFDFDDHFDSEATIFFYTGTKNKNKKPITIRILINAIISGKLV